MNEEIRFLNSKGDDLETADKVISIVKAVVKCVSEANMDNVTKISILHGIGTSLIYTSLQGIPSDVVDSIAASLLYNFSKGFHEVIELIKQEEET